MNTNQLRWTLAADANRREPPVKSVLAIALATGGAISTVMFFASLGFRNLALPQFLTSVDLISALSRPEFEYERQ